MKTLIGIVLFALIAFNGWGQNSGVGSIAKNAKVLDADPFKLAPFSEGYAVIQKGNLSAMIDKQGEFFLPYGKFNFWDQGSNVIQLKNGNYIQSPKLGFINGFALVTLPGATQISYSFINKEGKLAFPKKFADATHFHGDKAIASMDKKMGYSILRQDGTLEKFSTNQYSLGGILNFLTHNELVTYECGKWNNDALPTDYDHNYGYKDANGKIIIKCNYNDASPFSEKMASVMKLDKFGKAKWGFIDIKGNQVIDFMFSTKPHDYHNGFALVEPKEKNEFDYAYADRLGNIRFKCKRRVAERNMYLGDPYDFKNGYAFWGDIPDEKSWKKVLIDTSGKIHDIRNLKGTFSRKGKTYNGLDKNGFSIEDGDFFQNNEIRIKGFWGYGLANIDGNIVIPPVFRTISHFDPASKLAYAQFENEKGEDIEGYINREGVFVIIKGNEGKW